MSTPKDHQPKVFDRVNPLIRFSVTRYVLAIGIFVAIVAFGVVCCFTLGVDLMPSVNIPVVNISTTYTGASPTVIDQQVTQIIENSVSSVAGITDINSSSSLGSSRVTLSFDMSTDKKLRASAGRGRRQLGVEEASYRNTDAERPDVRRELAANHPIRRFRRRRLADRGFRLGAGQPCAGSRARRRSREHYVQRRTRSAVFRCS